MAQVRKDKVQVELEINGTKRVGTNLKDIEKIYKDLNRERKALTIGTDEYVKKTEEMRKVKGILDEQRLAAKGVKNAMNDLGPAIKGIGANIKAAFGPIALIGAAITAIVELTRATFQETKAIQSLKEEINQVSGLTGDALDSTASRAKAMADTFETDVREGFNAANAAANAYLQEGQAIDEVFPQALEKISDRLLGLSPEKASEFLNQVKEYAPVAEEAGISMDRFFNLVTEGLNKGVPTDKLIDSIKEFDIRIKTVTKGQRDTLEQTFGKNFTDEILTAIEKGEISSVEALERIGGKIGEVGEDSAAAKRVISDLFGGPGEDATARYLGLISQVGDKLSDVQDETNIYIKRKRELFELEIQANEATARLASLTDGTGNLFQKAGLQIKTFFVTQLADIIEFVRYFPEYFDAATSSGRAFANTLIAGFEKLIRVSIPFLSGLEALTGKSFKLPRFDIEDDPFEKVQEKIEADRKSLAEQQRQARLEEERKTQEAIRLAQLQAQKNRFKELEINMREEQEKMLSLEEEFQKQFQDLIKKENVEIIKTEDEKYKARLAVIERNEREKLTFLTEEALKEIQLGRNIEDAEEDMRENILTIQRAYLQKRIDLAKEFGEDVTALEQALARLNLQIAKGSVEETEEQGLFGITRSKMDATIGIAESAASTLMGIQDIISANQQRRLSDELNALNIKKQRELEAAGDSAKKRESIEKSYQAKKLALEESAAKKSKRIAISRAVIDGALAVMRIAADVPKADFGISTALLIAAQIAATAGQVATISSQAFAKGGILPGAGGLAEGPSHQKGGIKLVDGSGRFRGEIEGGEPILSISTYQNNRALVDSLLYSSQNLGGARIFQSGGFLPSSTTTPSSQVIDRAAFFSDSNIVGGLGRIEQVLGGLQLRIGELEAAEIGRMYTEYQDRKNGYQV